MPRVNEKLFCVDLEIHGADAPAVEEYLAAAGLPAAVTVEEKNGMGLARVYCETPEAAAAVRERMLHRGLPDLALFGVRVRNVQLRLLRARDWTERWKRYFRPVHISPRLVIAPEWADYAAATGEIVVRVNPGMCFGTGRHGTTRGCLLFLDRIARRFGPGPLSFLDIGCGSGILSMAAWRLGYRPVFAFDSDPDAVRTAQANLAASGAGQATVAVRNLNAWDGRRRAAVVAANILTPVLMENAERITASLDPGPRPAFLILSGIQKSEFPAVRNRFESLGLRLLWRRTLEGWTTGCLVPAAHFPRNSPAPDNPNGER